MSRVIIPDSSLACSVPLTADMNNAAACLLPSTSSDILRNSSADFEASAHHRERGEERRREGRQISIIFLVCKLFRNCFETVLPWFVTTSTQSNVKQRAERVRLDRMKYRREHSVLF